MIILASKSPRRHELLKKIVPTFKVVPADIDEHAIKAPINELATAISKLKAYKVALEYPDDLVLGVDTIVVFNNQVYGQPESEADAWQMLNTLSGQTHTVISGYTIIAKGHELNRRVLSKVTLNQLSAKTIDAYIATGLPFGKAGSYGVQDQGFDLVANIEGSYDNVMGLPTEDLTLFKSMFEDYL